MTYMTQQLCHGWRYMYIFSFSAT